MSDHERAMSDDQIETMAWELETKMMEIRKDPRAALADGLAKIRAMMLAELRAAMDADRARMQADFAKARAERDAAFAQMRAERDAYLEKLAAEWVDHLSSASTELRAAFADFIRLRQRKAAEADQRLQ